MTTQPEPKDAEAVPVAIEPTETRAFVRDLSVFDKDFSSPNVRNFSPQVTPTEPDPDELVDAAYLIEPLDAEMGDPKDSSAPASADSGASSFATPETRSSAALPWDTSVPAEKDVTTLANPSESGTPTSPSKTSPGKTKPPVEGSN